MIKLVITIGTALILSVAVMGQEKGNEKIILNSGATVEGQLQSTLDVKKAKPGDRVVLKTTKAIKENGQTVVPKGSKLIGRVTEVEKRSKTSNGSRLGLLFDRLESGNLNSDSAGADLFGSSSASARGTSSASSGGGLLGSTAQATGGLIGGVTNTVGSTVNTGIQTVGNVAGTAGTVVNSSTLVRTVNGIQISNSVNGSAQSGTVLEVPGRDLKLEKGTAIHLQLSSEVRRQ
jgi:hypothetical protein